MYLKNNLGLKNFKSKKCFGWKKYLVQKQFWVQTNFGSCSSCDMGHSDPLPPKHSQKPRCSLCVKFQPSSTPPSDRFWCGVVLLVLVLLVVVTVVKQSQLLVLRLSIEFDNSLGDREEGVVELTSKTNFKNHI